MLLWPPAIFHVPNDATRLRRAVASAGGIVEKKKKKVGPEQLKKRELLSSLLVERRSDGAEALVLPADRADGVRFGLESHAQLRGHSGNGSQRELEVEPLQQSGEKEEHLHPGQLLS